MEAAQRANYPFARQTTKGLIQSTDKFAHSKNAGCLSQSRRKLQQRMVASEMAIYASPSDQFNSRSNRTMIGRCGSWTRTQQGENMPILFKTQVNRTAKMPIPARRARVGGLCGFRSPAERVPTGSLKIGRCASVRELWRKWQAQSKHQREAAALPRTFKRAKSGDFERCGGKAGQNHGVVRSPRRSHLPAVRAVL